MSKQPHQHSQNIGDSKEVSAAKVSAPLTAPTGTMPRSAVGQWRMLTAPTKYGFDLCCFSYLDGSAEFPGGSEAAQIIKGKRNSSAHTVRALIRNRAEHFPGERYYIEISTDKDGFRSAEISKLSQRISEFVLTNTESDSWDIREVQRFGLRAFSFEHDYVKSGTLSADGNQPPLRYRLYTYPSEMGFHCITLVLEVLESPLKTDENHIQNLSEIQKTELLKIYEEASRSISDMPLRFYASHTNSKEWFDGKISRQELYKTFGTPGSVEIFLYYSEIFDTIVPSSERDLFSRAINEGNLANSIIFEGFIPEKPRDEVTLERSVIEAVQELRNQFRAEKEIPLLPAYPGKAGGVDAMKFLEEVYGEYIAHGNFTAGQLFTKDRALYSVVERRAAKLNGGLSVQGYFDTLKSPEVVGTQQQRKYAASATLIGASREDAARFFGLMKPDRVPPDIGEPDSGKKGFARRIRENRTSNSLE